MSYIKTQEGIALTHIGGPTVLLELDDWRILTDPTFDPPGRRYTFGFGTFSDKTEAPAVSVQQLGRIDAILLTHDHHADNLDDAGRELLETVPTVITTQSGQRRLALSNVRGLRPWSTTQLESPGKRPILVTATPARHGPPLSRPIAGDVIGFALQRHHDRPTAVWFSGDSVYYRGLRHVATKLMVDVAVLNMGAVRFGVTGPLRYTMNAAEATKLIKRLQPRIAVPVHTNGWSHFSESATSARKTFLRSPADVSSRIIWLPSGKRTIVAGIPDAKSEPAK